MARIAWFSSAALAALLSFWGASAHATSPGRDGLIAFTAAKIVPGTTLTTSGLRDRLAAVLIAAARPAGLRDFRC